MEPLLTALHAFLESQTGDAVDITHATPLAGGASRDMWLVTLRIHGEEGSYVLRRDPPTQMNDRALSRSQEFELMQAAYTAGIAVAEPCWQCPDPSVLGSPFFIMRFVEGISIGRKVVSDPSLAEARARLPAQLGHTLARIHALPASVVSGLPQPPEGSDPAQDAIDQARRVLDRLNVQNPALELGLRWAEVHKPAPSPLVVLHGDFRIGNVIVNADGLAAVADWEFSHIGDRHEDLGYPCMRDWRFGAADRRFAGISDREAFLTAYEDAAGVSVDRRAATYWEILGNVRWGVICLAQANRHLSGEEPGIELASLGRRSVEMQIEALRLITAWEGAQ
jgi:aminoglycoside phosphotransferase (APT) family kinase protein